MRPRMFYGWVVTWTAFAVLAISYGVQFSFGVFLADITEETGWSRTQLSLSYSLYIFVYSLISGYSGAMTDRGGPRRVIAVGAVFLGVGYTLTALSQEMWQFFIALGLIAAVGMSAAFVPCSSTVARWFERDRGKALGLATSGGSFGGFLVPPIAGLLASAYGWRVSYVVLGLATMVLLLAASRFMVRDPSQKGLEVDGRPRQSDSPVASDVGGVTRGEAVRMPIFWITGSVFFFSWLAIFMPFAHLVSFAEELGISKGLAATLISATGVGGIVGRTATGIVSDRIGRLPSLGAALALQAVAFLAFSGGSSLAVFYPAAIAFGFGYGGTTTMFPAIYSDQFGQAHIGAIVGVVFSVSGSAAAFGPALAGFLYDLTDSYRLGFVIGAALNLAALGMVIAMRLHVGRSTTSAPPLSVTGQPS